MTDCHPPLPQRENPHRPNIPRQKQTSNPPYPQMEPAVYDNKNILRSKKIPSIENLKTNSKKIYFQSFISQSTFSGIQHKR